MSEEIKAPPPPDDARLRELRQRAAELRAAREEREEAREDAMQVAAAERAVREEEAIAKLEQEIGAVGTHLAVVPTDMGAVIVRRPHALKFRRFQDKGEFTTEDLEQLVRPCVVYPPLGEFDALVHDLPATLQRVASAVCELAGFRAKEVTKKS